MAGLLIDIITKKRKKGVFIRAQWNKSSMLVEENTKTHFIFHRIETPPLYVTTPLQPLRLGFDRAG